MNRNLTECIAVTEKGEVDSMQTKETELGNREVLRLSNEESKKLTRECIQKALLHLIGRKSFDAISVTDIINRSGVSRAAFYRNYTSKSDVMDEISGVFMYELISSIKKKQYELDSRKFFLDLFSSVRERKEEFALLLEADVPKEYLFRMNEMMKDSFKIDTPERNYWYLGMTGALKEIVTEWFRTGMNEEPAEMADLLTGRLHFCWGNAGITG